MLPLFVGLALTAFLAARQALKRPPPAPVATPATFPRAGASPAATTYGGVQLKKTPPSDKPASTTERLLQLKRKRDEEQK